MPERRCADCKAFRDQGLGKQLIQWSIDRAIQRGCQLVQLTSDKRRPDTIRFYEKLGFKATHEGFKLKLSKVVNLGCLAHHIFAATQRRFNHTVFIGALRHLYRIAVIQCDTAVLEGCVAFSTGCVNTHSTYFTFVSRHTDLSLNSKYTLILSIISALKN